MGAVDLRYEPVPREELCAWCGGSGVNRHRHGAAYPCPDCAGTGLALDDDGEAQPTDPLDDYGPPPGADPDPDEEPIAEAVPLRRPLTFSFPTTQDK